MWKMTISTIDFLGTQILDGQVMLTNLTDQMPEKGWPLIICFFFLLLRNFLECRISTDKQGKLNKQGNE